MKTPLLVSKTMLTLADVGEKLKLSVSQDPAFFTEWRQALPDLTIEEVTAIDRLQARFAVQYSTSRLFAAFFPPDGQELLEVVRVLKRVGMPKLLAEINWHFAQLYRAKNNPDLAQQHYQTAHQLYTQLGAVKDLEKIEREWGEAST